MHYYPDYLPACTLSAEQTTQLNVISGNLRGDFTQRLNGRRTTTVRDVTLSLAGVQLPVFEYFVRDLCNEGVDWFMGKSITDASQPHQKMRIVEGKYEVVITKSMDYTVSFAVEVEQ